MSQVEEAVPVRSLIVGSTSFGPREINQVLNAISRDFSQYHELREGVRELASQPEPSPATKVRIGVGSYLLGRYQDAIKYLLKADGSALARLYLAKAYMATEQYEQAIEAFDVAAKAGYNPADAALGKVEALRNLGRAEEAKEILDAQPSSAQQSAEYHYQYGATLAALGEDVREVTNHYEDAIQLDGEHIGALFGLALENDRQGNDEAARNYLERSVQHFPPHVGSLLNLGLLYEDTQEYEKAAQCYERILKVYPDHPQARMYLKDAEASFDMVVDEHAERRHDRINQVLSTPVTDFELSVRARNCLQKMGIKTLGDLTKFTEQELLASKNFGETSLNEIKEMMTSRGLRLGQATETKRAQAAPVDPSTMSPDEQALLSKPVTELNLSVRARKCMIRLGIKTIGELIRCNQDELLECKNFGVTSLNEVREKLAAANLKLRGE